MAVNSKSRAQHFELPSSFPMPRAAQLLRSRTSLGSEVSRVTADLRRKLSAPRISYAGASHRVASRNNRCARARFAWALADRVRVDLPSAREAMNAAHRRRRSKAADDGNGRTRDSGGQTACRRLASWRAACPDGERNTEGERGAREHSLRGGIVPRVRGYCCAEVTKRRCYAGCSTQVAGPAAARLLGRHSRGGARKPWRHMGVPRAV